MRAWDSLSRSPDCDCRGQNAAILEAGLTQEVLAGPLRPGSVRGWWVQGRPLVPAAFLQEVQVRTTRAALDNLTRGRIPPLYGSPVAYQRDPRGCNHAARWWVALERATADCEDLAAWRAAERFQRTGRWPGFVVAATATPGLVHVRLVDEDPSRILVLAGRYVPGRRAPDSACPVPGAIEAGGEAGQVPEHRDPSLLHPALRAGLAAAARAGISVDLVSGRRSAERQIALWEDRFRQAREAGEAAPSSWDAAELEWVRWASWIEAERKGRHGRPRLALPGNSPHQAGRAMDLGGTADALEAFAALNAATLGRPVPGEPWHFEPLEDAP